MKWTEYIPMEPTPKQRAFLMLGVKEALFGGRAGGGKSEVLLGGALQYVDIPGYSAIIFRRTLTDLKQPGSLIDRAHKWLTHTRATWVGSEHTWYFPTAFPDGTPGHPAKLAFGYIGETDVETRYQSAEYQYIGWDEVTQHEESHYLYLFSRLRRIACPIHKVDKTGSPKWDDNCPLCGLYRQIPLRVRAATNPGGRGHEWVRNRFMITYNLDWTLTQENDDRKSSGKELLTEHDIPTPEECINKGIDPVFVGKHPTRKFIPSYLRDNPYIDQQSYEESLENLPPTERRRLRFGDWTDNPDSRFKRKWAKYFSIRSEYFALGRDGSGKVYPRDKITRIFGTVDPAASVREGPIEDQLRRGREASWTVISTWALTDDYHLLWLEMVRFQDEIPEVVREIVKSYKRWRHNYFKIESNGLGKGVAQYAAQSGIPVKETTRHSDKLVNATSAIVRMESGRVWFPQHAHWLETAENEIFSWIGDPSQRDDIIDTLSDACNDVNWQAISAEDAHTQEEAEGHYPLYIPFAG